MQLEVVSRTSLIRENAHGEARETICISKTIGFCDAERGFLISDRIAESPVRLCCWSGSLGFLECRDAGVLGDVMWYCGGTPLNSGELAQTQRSGLKAAYKDRKHDLL